MESNDFTERKAFDETKTGVKGLMDSGITEIPDMFRVPQAILETLKPSLHKLKVPTIDLEGGDVHYKNGEDMIIRESLVEQIGEAAETWGVFQVINHGIPIDVLERMLEGTRGFHELDSEVKKEFHSRDHDRNFFYYSNIDLFSSAAAMWRDSLCCYTAPDPPPSEDLPAVIREIVMEYSKEMMKLGELIFELLSEALGLNPNHLKHMDCTKFQVMSGHYYPHCPQPDLAIGLTKHKDLSFFTILLQDNIPGLQVLHDQDWIEVPPVPGALVINIGDLLQLITNDKFISVEHMVIANGASQARVSVPYFFTSFMRENPSIYGPIRELLSEQNPPKYRDCSINELKNIAGSKTFSIPRLQYFKI